MSGNMMPLTEKKPGMRPAPPGTARHRPAPPGTARHLCEIWSAPSAAHKLATAGGSSKLMDGTPGFFRCGAVATTAGRGRLDLVMQALEVRTPEALAALVVVLADTYRLPLEETATMADDQIQSASSPRKCRQVVAGPCEGIGGQVERGVRWHARGKRRGGEGGESGGGEGEEKEEEEEILGRVLEWGNPVVRRGPLQRPVQTKDWEIDPADLKWGAQLLRYSEVRAEQRE
jgi:hypothetical protein